MSLSYHSFAVVARRAGLQLALLLSLGTTSQQATIGDGRVSLYTGRPINGSLWSPSSGSCEVEGRHYPSETAIPRDHPCHYCICYRSQVTCYWKHCAAAPQNCAVMHFENVCNPSLYMCEIPEEARPQPVRKYGDRIFSLRRRRRLPRSAAAVVALPPFNEPFPVEFNDEFLARALRAAPWPQEAGPEGGRSKREAGNPLYRKGKHNHVPLDKTCTILGVKYNLGEVIGVASDVCMECRCAAGKMFCSPRCCFLPSPLTLTHAHLHALTSAAPPPARPHPLYYIRNQVSTR